MRGMLNVLPKAVIDCAGIRLCVFVLQNPQQVVDAGDAVRADLRRHEQALLGEEAAKMEQAHRVELQVGGRVDSLSFSLAKKKKSASCLLYL